MKILAIETSSSRGSLSLYDTKSAQPLAESFWLRDKSHSEILLAEFEKLLKQGQLEASDIDSYAVGLGPGSFTGIRVGINFVRSLAYNFNRPVYTMNSLQLLAEDGLKSSSRGLCLINAYRNLMYCAGYDNSSSQMKAWLKPQALSAQMLEEYIHEDTLCFGNGYHAFESQFSPRLKALLKPPDESSFYPRAEKLAQIAAEDPQRITSVTWREVVPLYIRASEAEEKLRTI